MGMDSDFLTNKELWSQNSIFMEVKGEGVGWWGWHFNILAVCLVKALSS